MARSKKTPGPGHNIALTEDEIAALEAYFVVKIRQAQAVADEKKAAHKSALSDVNALFSKVKGDLKVPRQDFEDLLDKLKMDPVEFRAWWEKTVARYGRQGLPVGQQQELALGDTADDKAVAHAHGLAQGRAGADPVPPKTLSTILHQDWMTGWHEGQKELFLQLEKADGIFAKLAQAKGELTEDGGDDDSEDDEDAADPEVIKRKADALKDSGWTEPTGDEAKFEDAA